MEYMILSYLIFALYLGLFVAAAASDVSRFVIPNVIVAAIAVLFPLAALLQPLDVLWWSHIGAAASVFAVGAVGFAFRAVGAGDVKLLTAAALWTGLEHLLDLVLFVALTGGAVALAIIVLRRLMFMMNYYLPRGRLVVLPDPWSSGGIPYGVAIAVGAVVVALRLPHLGFA